MEKMTGAGNGYYYRSLLANEYLNGNKTLDDLIKSCSSGYHIRMVARVLTECLLTDHDQKTMEKAKMALGEFAKKHTAPVAEEIVRRIVYTVSWAEEKGREWKKENLDFLFQLLDKEELTEISFYTKKYVMSFNWKSDLQNEDRYGMLEKKFKMPGASLMCKYILRRAKHREEIEHLENIAGRSEYYDKDDKNGPSTKNNTGISKNELYGYLNMLTNTALRERDIELVRAYAHFYEFVYFALINAGTNVCKERMEKEYFFEVGEGLFENGSKMRVVEVLFEGIDKVGKEKKELHLEMLKKLVEKDEDVFIKYYEVISSRDKVRLKELVENFILDFGSAEMKKQILDKKIEGGGREAKTFINPEGLKRKN